MTGGAPNLGTILGVFAHPDDEAYLCGALMAAAVDAGRRVVCVTATRGEAGFPDDDTRSIAERRAQRSDECAACLDVLGVTEHHFLDYADGGCHLVEPGEPVDKLSAVVNEIQPDTVLTFGPDGMTGHDDHMAVGRWATAAVRAARVPARLLYATKTSDWNDRFRVHVDLDAVMMVEGMQPPAMEPDALAVWFRPEGALLDRKVAALRCQASQVEPLAAATGEAAFRDLVAEEFFWDPDAP